MPAGVVEGGNGACDGVSTLSSAAAGGTRDRGAADLPVMKYRMCPIKTFRCLRSNTAAGKQQTKQKNYGVASGGSSKAGVWLELEREGNKRGGKGKKKREKKRRGPPHNE